MVINSFSGDRYMTKGISNRLSADIQGLLWRLIDSLEIEKDYLQVFEIESISIDSLRIVHKQEVPIYENEYLVLGLENIKKEKIFVIDSGEYSTMMYSHEY